MVVASVGTMHDTDECFSLGSSSLVMYNVAVSLSLIIRKYITWNGTRISRLILRACRFRSGESLPISQQSDMSPLPRSTEGFRSERLHL